MIGAEILPVIEPWPLAARIHDRHNIQNQWVLVVTEPGKESKTCDTFLVEFESLYDGVVRRVVAHSLEDWKRAVSSDRKDVLVITHESSWNPSDWRKLDSQYLMREGLTIVIADQEAVKGMSTFAPHLWSQIGGMVWALQMDEDGDYDD